MSRLCAICYYSLYTTRIRACIKERMGRVRSLQITDWCHEIFERFVPAGGVYIDATMGQGQVWAFDIQEKALELTRELLEREGMDKRARLILCGHEHMDRYLEPERVDGICFNFGYLPGGDHRIATRPETSVAAVEQGLKLLKPGGMMSLCIYSGGDTGFEERDALLAFLRELPSRQYTVIQTPYYNRSGHPPLPVFVFRQK